MGTSNFFIRIHPIKILFNSRATHSFISARLVETLLLLSMSRHSLPNIALSDGKVVSCWELFIDCPIQIHGHNFSGGFI